LTNELRFCPCTPRLNAAELPKLEAEFEEITEGEEPTMERTEIPPASIGESACLRCTCGITIRSL
jgi:hypothetical protein